MSDINYEIEGYNHIIKILEGAGYTEGEPPLASGDTDKYILEYLGSEVLGRSAQTNINVEVLYNIHFETGNSYGTFKARELWKMEIANKLIRELNTRSAFYKSYKIETEKVDTTVNILDDKSGVMFKVRFHYFMDI